MVALIDLVHLQGNTTQKMNSSEASSSNFTRAIKKYPRVAAVEAT